jgi:hypothetical protein
MSTAIRKRVWLWIGLGIALIVGLAALAGQDNLFRWFVNPKTPYQIYEPPPAPDYANPASWALRPEAPPPGAWETPWGVDVFFVSPTTDYSGEQWNAPYDASVPKDRLEHSVLPNFAGAFARAGALYAPHYRQATLFSFLTHREDAVLARVTAYKDVERAFDSYLSNDNRGRAIVLVGVGQGGLHALGLLLNRFSQDPALQERLVAAYLIETAVPLDLFNGPLSWTRVCDTQLATGCVIAWGTADTGDRREATRFLTRSQVWDGKTGLVAVEDRGLVCVNPLLWSADGTFAPERLHKGGARASGLETGVMPAILPGQTSAQCVDGLLLIDPSRASALKQGKMFGDLYKTPTFNLFYADIFENAAIRAELKSKQLDLTGAKPAPPLPPLQIVRPAPIRKPGEIATSSTED